MQSNSRMFPAYIPDIWSRVRPETWVEDGTTGIIEEHQKSAVFGVEIACPHTKNLSLEDVANGLL